MESQAKSPEITNFNRAINQVEKYINIVSKWLYWVAGAGLIAMLVLVVADIIGIKILSHPVPGGIEITAFLGVVAIGFAIAYVQVLHGHIQVDFLLMKLPPRAKAFLDVITTLFSIAFFVFLTWQSWKYAMNMQSSGEVSMTQKIPYYPFIYGLVVCYFVTFLVLVIELVKSILKAGKKWIL